MIVSCKCFSLQFLDKTLQGRASRFFAAWTLLSMCMSTWHYGTWIATYDKISHAFPSY